MEFKSSNLVQFYDVQLGNHLYIYELVYVFYWDNLNAQNGGKKFDLLMSKVAGKDRQIKKW